MFSFFFSFEYGLCLWSVMGTKFLFREICWKGKFCFWILGWTLKFARNHGNLINFRIKIHDLVQLRKGLHHRQILFEPKWALKKLKCTWRILSKNAILSKNFTFELHFILFNQSLCHCQFHYRASRPNLNVFIRNLIMFFAVPDKRK